MEEWIMALSAWFCAFLMCVIGAWAYHRKTPMHFWSGTTVPSSEIANISAYNRANAFMWWIYAVFWLADGVLAFFDVFLSAVVMGVIAVGGIPVLVGVYSFIYHRYRTH